MSTMNLPTKLDSNLLFSVKLEQLADEILLHDQKRHVSETQYFP